MVQRARSPYEGSNTRIEALIASFYDMVASAGVKSVQRGTITLTGSQQGTATITAVDVSKAELRFLGCTGDQASAASDTVYLVLTNTTTITATRASSTGTATVSWELTEH